MNIANSKVGSDLVTEERQARGALRNGSMIESVPREILQSALEALSQGRVSDVVKYFDDRFRFIDHPRTLEFTDKLSLREFFQRSRERFPDTTLEIVSLFQDGDHAIAEWKLTATQTVPYAWISYRSRISLQGATIVRIEDGKIVEWSDYYDQNSSQRSSQDRYWLGLNRSA